MIIIPAIDLKDGKCVRLSRGKEDSSVIFNENPIEQARFFESQGCKRIHIVDLDAAFGKNENNKSIILKIRKALSLDIQLGGGIKSEKDVNFWIEEGINFLIIGSMVVNDPVEFNKIIQNLPNRIYISLDDYKEHLMVKGWVQESSLKTLEIIKNYNESKIKGFVFTDVSRDGMLQGLNIKKINYYLMQSKKPIIASGGLSDRNDIKKLLELKQRYLEGVVIGKSFYLGKINIKDAIKLIELNVKN